MEINETNDRIYKSFIDAFESSFQKAEQQQQRNDEHDDDQKDYGDREHIPLRARKDVIYWRRMRMGEYELRVSGLSIWKLLSV